MRDSSTVHRHARWPSWPLLALALSLLSLAWSPPSATLLGGTALPGQFQPPLVQTLIGGQVSYEPITFQNSLRIEMGVSDRPNFYQFDYLRLQQDTPVPSYDGTLTPQQQQARSRVV